MQWNGPDYQYVNRLAMLHFLDHLNAIPSYLVFVCFVGDFDMRGPATDSEWRVAIDQVKPSLGISKLPPNVIDLFLSVEDLAG